MLNFKKGEVISFRVRTADTISNWEPPIGLAVVLLEHGLAHGANPEETIQIAPACRTDLNKELGGNDVRVSWNPEIDEEGVNLIDVDYSLSSTIPRSWAIERQGIVSAVALQKIQEAVAGYW